MASPTYLGKQRKPTPTGWFSGLASWWNAYAPEYVTSLRRGGVAKLPTVVSPSVDARSVEVKANAPAKEAVANSEASVPKP
jgi:hypothetical protein